MKGAKEIKSVERRAFMKKAGVGVGAVGAVAIGLPKTSAEAASGTVPGSRGYRETDHVKRFYASARF